ncbi:hypothetical protein DERF_000654 [Dermatophagoides farinae]|uniref:Uncharacterized protein n=1 Tax=Dermatophagoides farinae TaxID=6954 RepID=A0A922I7T7_DERFA|nr:hypothetical protein DERF_000654 [Dermatophagoides farinae]
MKHGFTVCTYTFELLHSVATVSVKKWPSTGYLQAENVEYFGKRKSPACEPTLITMPRFC